MTAEEIRKIVDDERTEQLTAQVCRHWQVAADRLEGLVQELASAQGIYQGRSGKSPSGMGNPTITTLVRAAVSARCLSPRIWLSIPPVWPTTVRTSSQGR